MSTRVFAGFLIPIFVICLLSGCGGAGDEVALTAVVTPESIPTDTKTEIQVVCKETLSIEWKQGVVEDRLFLDTGGDADTAVVTVGDPPLEARRFGGAQVLPSSDGNDIADDYMQFRVDDSAIFEGAPTSQVQIEIEYYDEAAGTFMIQYDALDGAFKETEAVGRTGSGAFQTAVFTLEDVYFGNRNNGADFRIADLNRESMIVRSVTLKYQKADAANVIDCVELLTVSWEIGEEEDLLFLDAGGDVDTEVVSVGRTNTEALKTGGGHPLPSPDGNTIEDYYMQFYIADDTVHAGYPTTLAQVAVEYFDEGTGSIFMQYDAQDGDTSGDGIFKDSDTFSLTDSGEFKTAVFSLSDAYFANRDNGADFRISEWGGNPVTVRSVSVTLQTAASVPADDWENATITWEQGGIQGGLFLEVGGDVDTEIVTVGDPEVKARRTGGGQVLPSTDGNDIGDHYMLFGIDDNLLFEGSPTDKVQIDVEYFDEGAGAFVLEYDALSGGPSGNGLFKESEPEYKTDSGAFKTAVFLLDDVYFGNRNNGGDFRITNWSEETLTVRSVTVTLLGEGLVPGFTNFPMVAILSDIQGEVLFQQTGMDGFYIAKEGQALLTNGAVLTGANASVFITVSDGAVLYLGPNSIFGLEMGLYSEDLVLPRFKLLFGEMEIVSGSSGFVVYTPSGFVGAIGSRGKVMVDEWGETELECYEGNCFLDIHGQSVGIVPTFIPEEEPEREDRQTDDQKDGDKIYQAAPSDSDQDGIPNLIDLCPEEANIGYGIDAQGCPITLSFEDNDGDGIVNSKDLCPNLGDDGYGLDGVGCPLPPPDSDGDGLPDHEDNCPNTPGTTLFSNPEPGCPWAPIPKITEPDQPPDSDGDGYLDHQDWCPDIYAPDYIEVEIESDFMPTLVWFIPYGDGSGCLLGDFDRNGTPDHMECADCAPPLSENDCTDWDKDGICDDEDLCLFRAGTASNNGCPDPDSDGDGVYDHQDLCPGEIDEGYGVNPFGCPNTPPDKDGDGVLDAVDKCPAQGDLGYGVGADGCPHAATDQDGDGIVDAVDECPNDGDQGDGIDQWGCPAGTADRDGDGVIDSVDRCPDEGDQGNGILPSGCPVATNDRDNDGVVDGLDICPNQGDLGNGVNAKGCPIIPGDKDGDGVLDAFDRCPGQGDQGYGVNKHGCPKQPGDRDGDGVIDALDNCPNEGDQGYGLNKRGCPNPPPDSDGDGNPDSSDSCPRQGDQGNGVDRFGCPNPPPNTDSDGDGVLDKGDSCPDEGDQGYGVYRNGCPVPPPPPPKVPTANIPSTDSDGDGVPDDKDSCPDEGDQGHGVSRNGCPVSPPPATDSDGD